MSTITSSSPVSGTVEGKRYLTQDSVIGYGYNPQGIHSTIYIPEMQLQIDQYSVQRQPRSSTSIKEMELKTKHILHSEEYKLAAQSELESREKVQIPISLTNRISALLNEKEALESRMREVDGEIAILAKKIHSKIGT